jgi:hypothetical protein
VCWLAFWFIRGTHGRERVFTVGWFLAILLPPLETLERGFTGEIKYICAFGLAVSLLAGYHFCSIPLASAIPLSELPSLTVAKS